MMLRVLGGLAAALLLAVTGVLDIGRATAGDLAAERPNDILLMSGTDLWRNGAFLYGGLLWSRNDLDHDGFVLKITAGGGSYRYFSGAIDHDVAGRVYSADVLPGWRFKREGLLVTVFAGADYQNHHLSPDDPGATLRGPVFGVKGGLEMWYEPTERTMVSADVFATSSGPSYSAHANVGWRMFDRFYAGPEVAAFAYDDNYRQFRAGLHVTALKTGTFEWSGGLGWAHDSDRRESAYARLSILARR